MISVLRITESIKFILLICVAVAMTASSQATVAQSKYTKVVSGNQDDILKLSLGEAIDRALQANRSLLNAGNDLKIRELTLDQAKSVFNIRLFPGGEAGLSGSDSDNDTSLGVRGTLDKKFKNGIEGTLIPRVERSDDEYSASMGFSITIPLFRGYGKLVNLNSVDTSSYTLRTARRSMYVSRVNTIISTVTGVYDIIKQEKLLKILRLQAQRIEEHTEILKIKKKNDLISSLDVYRAEIRLKDVEDDLALAWKTYTTALDRLKIILAVPVERAIEIQAPLKAEPVNIASDAALRIALQNKIELEQARDNISEAIRNAEIAKHNLMPEINIAFDYNGFGSSEDFSRSYQFNENRWNVKLISSTDWERKSEKIAFRQRLLDVKNVRLALKSKQAELKRAVREQLDALKESEERIKLKNKQIKQAKAKQALAEIKFRHSLADNSDFIEAETELQQARVNRLAAAMDYIIGTYRLRATLGTLLAY